MRRLMRDGSDLFCLWLIGSRVGRSVNDRLYRLGDEAGKTCNP
jgi:hypothetical protein